MLRREERLIFRAFYDACPDFAGRVVDWKDGPDPPDLLCEDSAGKRIGVELGEWLNEDQIRSNKRLERWQESFLTAIRSEDVSPPQNVGFVRLGPKARVLLPPAEAATFRHELLTLIQHVDRDWNYYSDCRSPQRVSLTSFPDFPCLARYLDDIRFYSRMHFDTFPGNPWIAFPTRGGFYSEDDAVEALLNLLRNKTAKYATLHAEHSLDELYLVAYYNKAILYNSPYFVPGFGLTEVAKIARAEVAKNPGAFQKIFLFDTTEPDLSPIQLWP